MKRNNFWQAVRGICILCVVLIHTQNGTTYSDLSGLSWNFNYWIVERQFIDFPVAVFIFLSGYFTSIDNVPLFPVPYLKKRLVRLIPSYFVWTTVYTAFSALFQNQAVSMKMLIKNYLFGGAAAPLYYIIVLFQLTLLTPLLIRCLRSPMLHKGILCITPAYLLILYICNIRFHAEPFFYSGLFPAWLSFYYLGLSVKNGKYHKMQSLAPQHISLFVALALICSIVEGFVLIRIATPAFAASQIKLSSFVYSFLIICFLLSLHERTHPLSDRNLFVKLGDNSFGVFYVHIVFITIFSNFICKISGLLKNLPLLQLVELIPAVVLSLAVIKIVQKTVGAKYAGLLFGF